MSEVEGRTINKPKVITMNPYIQEYHYTNITYHDIHNILIGLFHKSRVFFKMSISLDFDNVKTNGFYINMLSISKVEDILKINLDMESIAMEEYIDSVIYPRRLIGMGITGMSVKMNLTKLFKDLPETYCYGEIRSILFVG